MENGLELLYVTLGVVMLITAFSICNLIHNNVCDFQKNIVGFHQDYELLDRGMNIYE